MISDADRIGAPRHGVEQEEHGNEHRDRRKHAVGQDPEGHVLAARLAREAREGIAGERAEKERQQPCCTVAMMKQSTSALKFEASANTPAKFSGCHSRGQKVGTVRLVSAAVLNDVMIM